jgi:drug/metabolite transporter (DMT)-like permease
MRRLIGFAFVIASAVSFGAMPIFARVAYANGLDPITLLFLRFAIATPIMLGLMAVRRAPFPRGAPLAGLAALGALGYVGQSFCYFTALTLASAGLVALLLYLYPILVAAAAVILLKEKLTAAKVIAIGLALVGAVLTMGFGGGGKPAGVALGVGAALIYSVYIIAGSRIMKSVSALPSSTVVIASAAIVYAVIASVRGPSWPTSPEGWIAVVCVAVVSTVVAIGGFFAGMERIGPTNASTLSTVEPAVTVCLAAAFLGETVSALTLAGGVLILAAVVLLARSEIGSGRPNGARTSLRGRGGTSGE